jgi:hypothetical protein
MDDEAELATPLPSSLLRFSLRPAAAVIAFAM